MSNITSNHADLAATIGISEQELEQRKAFLQFGPDEADLLRQLHGVLKGRHGPFVDALYTHLSAFEETRAILADPALLQRLKPKQEAYFDSLTAGDYGLAYATERLKTGLTHQQIGLKPQWCIGGYGQYLAWLLPEIRQTLGNDPDKYASTLLALVKVMLLDIELTVNAYFHADHEMLRLLAQAFDSNIEGLLITDAQGRMLHSNDKATTISGYSAKELVKQPLLLLLPPAEQNKFETVWSEVQTSGVWLGELSFQGKDGHAFPAWVNISSVKDDSGAITHFVVGFSDVTVYRNAQEELRQRTKELSRSNQELEQFAYVASHDLQEPLRMVASFTQLLSRRYKGKLDAEADEFIGFAVDGATRMQLLINDLLAYARVGSRSKPFAAVDLNQVVQRVVSNLHLAIQDSGAQLQYDVLPTVMADASQLTQLLQNLIGNAIKFRGEAAPQIRLSATQNDHEWQFELRDNGIGIAPEFAERIFVIFQRLHTKEQYPGTGIGLAICKKIVERHGGRIWVESTPGQGTAFYFTLPAITTSGEN